MADRTHKTVFELSAVDRATQVFNQVESGLGKLKRIATGAFAVGGAAAFIADAARYRATLDDLADTTGDNVRTLDALARQYTISTGSVEGFDTALTHLAKNLNSTDDEGKAAAQAITAIGLNVQALRALKPADAMLEIAKALGAFEDGASKVAVANALMGKEGARQLPYLKDLAEAGELHGRITAEEAAQAERLMKAWRGLIATFEDSKQALASGVIPQMADWLEANREALKIAGSVNEGLRLFVFNLDAMTTEKPAAEIRRLTKSLEEYQKAAQGGYAVSGLIRQFMLSPTGATFGGRESDLQKQIALLKFLERQQALELTGPEYLDARDLKARQRPGLDFSPQTIKKRAALSNYDQRVLELQQQAAKDASGGGEFIETSLAIKAGKYNVVDELTGKVRQLTAAEKQNLLQLAAARDTEASYKALREEKLKADLEIASTSDAENRRLVDLAEHYKDLTSSSRALIREEEQLADLRRRGLLTEAQYQEILIVRSEKAREQIIGIGKDTEIAAAAGQQLGLSFTSAMDQIVFGSGKAVHGLDLVKAAALDVMKVIYGKQVTGPVAEALSLGITRAFGPRPSYPDASSITGPYGGFDAGAIAGADFVGSFAVGTDYVPRTGFALVHQGEKITPAGENGGGVTVVQHINFAVGIRGEVRAEIANMLPHLARAAAAAVRDDERRGRG